VLTAEGEWRDLGTPVVGTGQRLAYNDDISYLLMQAPRTFFRVKVYDVDKYFDGITAREDAVIAIYDLVAEPDPVDSGWGNDWLAGGTGQDARTPAIQRIGGAGDDILIGGQTAFDETDIQTAVGGAGREVLIGGSGRNRNP
jgi:hypothetical protein